MNKLSDAEIILNETESWRIDFDNVSLSEDTIDSEWEKNYENSETLVTLLEDGSNKVILDLNTEEKSTKRHFSYESICSQSPLAKYLIVFTKESGRAHVFKINNLEERKSAKLKKELRLQQIQRIESWINKN